MAKPDKKLPKAVQAATAMFTQAPAEPAVKEETAQAPSKVDVKAEVHKEIYTMVKRGEIVPGYSILPASKAEANKTVETFLLQVGADALCKMKTGISDKYVTSTKHHKTGVIRGEDAKYIEYMGIDAPDA